jgi:RNA ligase (TIGR02306 family)
MSTFEVPILRIDDVYDHPNADRLSILRIRGYEAVANKHPDGAHRYAKGEAIIYVPEGAVVPDAHLIERGYWNEKDAKGILAGSKGNRVKAIHLRGVLSQGLVWKIGREFENGTLIVNYGDVDAGVLPAGAKRAHEGDNVAEFYGITKYEPPVPSTMDGLMKGCFESRFDFDIENIKAFPDLFVAGEPVVVTEKLHGTFARISFMPQLSPDPELFGDGRIAITSKGMGANGLTFMNVPANDRALYVQALKPIAEAFQRAAESQYPLHVVHLMGEVFGPGVQDLHYGLTEKTFRAFEVAISDGASIIYLDDEAKEAFFIEVGVLRVPILYRGPFDRALIDGFANGSTTIRRKMDAQEGAHIREGVVITTEGDQAKRNLPLGKRLRPILKHVSPAYLTRKGGTEYQ